MFVKMDLLNEFDCIDMGQRTESQRKVCNACLGFAVRNTRFLAPVKTMAAFRNYRGNQYAGHGNEKANDDHIEQLQVEPVVLYRNDRVRFTVRFRQPGDPDEE